MVRCTEYYRARSHEVAINCTLLYRNVNIGVGGVMGEWIEVTEIDEIKKDHWKTFEISQKRISIFNLKGKYYAIEDICPHDGGALAEGELDGEEIVCPRHGAQFSILTGKVTQPPAFEDIATFPTRIVDGKVQVKV